MDFPIKNGLLVYQRVSWWNHPLFTADWWFGTWFLWLLWSMSYMFFFPSHWLSYFSRWLKHTHPLGHWNFRGGYVKEFLKYISLARLEQFCSQMHVWHNSIPHSGEVHGSAVPGWNLLKVQVWAKKDFWESWDILRSKSCTSPCCTSPEIFLHLSSTSPAPLLHPSWPLLHLSSLHLSSRS